MLRTTRAAGLSGLLCYKPLVKDTLVSRLMLSLTSTGSVSKRWSSTSRLFFAQQGAVSEQGGQPVQTVPSELQLRELHQLTQSLAAR